LAAALPRWAQRLLPSLLLACFAALAVTSMRLESVTSDEVAHLPAGYTYVLTGDFRLNPQHPPLVKALAGAPLAFLPLKRIDDTAGWATADDRIFGADFLVHNYEPLDRILFAGRLPMVALGVFFGAALFRWAEAMWGFPAAVVALFLYCFSPNMLAHARLVTTDAGIAGFTLCTLFALWRFTAGGRRADAALCGLLLGCALLAKYSGVLTALLVGCLLVASLRLGRSGRQVAEAALWIAGIAALVVTVGFGSPRGLVRYVESFQQMSRDFDMRQQAFLWGWQASGFWYYYLLAQLWKTPLPALLLFAAALLLMPLRGREARRDWLFVLLPIAAFHGAGTVFRPNIGLRHVLPVFPFLFLAAGWAGGRMIESGNRGRAAVLVLVLWTGVGTLRVHPHYLAYFNELAGGPAGGVRYLSDSNLEWGQDVAGLRSYIERTRPARARIAVFAPLALEAQGVIGEPIKLRDLVWPEEGVTYFVGTNHLIRASYANNPALHFEWLDRYRPVDTIGWSIYVYRFSTDEADRGREDVIFVPRRRWYDEARAQLEAVLRHDPRFAEARRLLAELLAQRAADERVRAGAEAGGGT
jgi:4-amino-4-deoxy-L-arabinose transferase-like glycosyltransferase